MTYGSYDSGYTQNEEPEAVTVVLSEGETLQVTVERTGRTYTLDDRPILRRVS